MIRWRYILRFLAYVLFGIAAAQIAPLALALAGRDPGMRPFLISVAATAAAAGLLHKLSKRVEAEFTHKEALLLVSASWVTVCALGSLPYCLSPQFPTLTDAVFESVSGFTTTGATILRAVESAPPSINFWRCFTHWLGGMGIILLGIAVLPLIGAGGIELYRAEFSGARSEKLTPRIAETAAALWKIYAGLTVLQYAALRMAGMSRFDAVCHATSTISTGGFSTRNLSVEAFRSPTVEAVVIVFMLASGVNFTLHYRLLIERRFRRFLSDSELQLYVLLVGLTTLAVSASLSASAEPAATLRSALFQVSSIMTTTGFTSANFEAWPPFAQLLLLALMFVGGCTGSTAGGLKVSRMMLLTRVVRRQFRRITERRGVFSVRVGGHPVSEAAIDGLLNLVYLAFLINFCASLVLAACGIDIVTSITAVAAAMFNVGPALGSVGPYENYGHLPTPAKWVLSFCMLAGRLEFYTLLVLFTPEFWRR